MQACMFERDEKGRPVAADGYPTAGLATIEEVAIALSVSKGTVYAMVNAGRLEGRRFGRSLRVSWSSLREQGLI